MKKAILIQSNGEISVIYPNTRYKLPNESDDDFIMRISEKTKASSPDYSNSVISIVEETDIPARDDNRNKWRVKQVGGKQVVFIDQNIRTKKDIVKDAEKRLDDELAKPNPDPVKTVKFMRECELARTLPNRYFEKKIA